MNYYKRHLGDYAKDTATLTMIEHGAYTLLLDYLYLTERALPVKTREIFVICRAKNRQEKVAVAKVLKRYFVKNSDGFIQKRAVEEIEKAQEKSARNREIGALGGRPRNPKAETQTVSKKKPNGCDLETQTVSKNNPIARASHKPLATNHKEEPPLTPPRGLDWVVWERWSDYRAKIRKPIKPVSVPAAQRKLAGFGPDQAAVVEQCIANGWQGLIPLKDVAKETGPPWWSSESATLAKAAELRIDPPRRGESLDQFRGRIRVAMTRH